MNALFVHDHRLKKNNDFYYTTGGLSDDVTKRYTNCFNSLTIICRASEIDNTSGLVKIENSDVFIKPIFNSKLIPSKKIIKHLSDNIKNANLVIVRLPSILGLYAAIIACRLHKPLFVEVVGSAFESYWYKNFLGKILALPLNLLNKYVVKKANYVLYVTEDYLQKKYPCNNVKIGCSDVVLDKRSVNVIKNRLKKIDKMPNLKKLVIGTLAQIDQKYKGHETVFKTISEIKKNGYQIEYKLAGSGNKEYLLSLARKYNIEKSIIFCGQIRHSDINEWIDSLDIYIQPSLTEGMPRSVIEALYRACPTIVSNAGGMYELVDKKFTFQKSNYFELEQILLKLDKNQLKNMAQRNFSFSEKFDYNILNLKRNDFYNYIRNEVQNK